MTTGEVATANLTSVFRDEWSAVVATVARRLGGDLEAAEDAAQEAFTSAARTWPRDGVPARPGAWLTVAAWRKAVDRLRRDQLFSERMGEIALAEEQTMREPEDRSLVDDDLLALIFACCHPELSLDVRVALTLRFVVGMTTREIAGAFLTPEATMGQRLFRAKRKIRKDGLAFTVPDPKELSGRLSGVLSVVYLVFNEGYAASGGIELVRGDLCEEALWLGRLLHRILPDDAEVAGLLALMMVHRARADSRRDAMGRPVPLAEQDRSRWDRDAIAEATGLLDSALHRGVPGPYQIQAAIAAVHAEAPCIELTDWAQISLLYAELARVAPSPVVEINRAVAVGLADGPEAGLDVLRPVLLLGELTGYAPLHAAHADLLDRSGDRAAADAAWRRALDATRNEALRAELARRIDQRSA
ncbi:RNA polymerase subunit sigma-24 [Nocardia sputorum]|uniref:RNA polymerase sigma factor n=1 Tax=Nocardia sputorum TaxID=2984338 RepID=UPI0024922EB1|nr:sigma-70 family RNA polymerase sigma factor [Nocardia sputorum]BDT92402.1 RNA polymerase subunit sigma-24 [Nocardia sputorum]